MPRLKFSLLPSNSGKHVDILSQGRRKEKNPAKRQPIQVHATKTVETVFI